MKPKDLKNQVEGFLNRNDKLVPQERTEDQAARFIQALDAHQQAIAQAIQAVDAAIAAYSLNAQPATLNR